MKKLIVTTALGALIATGAVAQSATDNPAEPPAVQPLGADPAPVQPLGADPAPAGTAWDLTEGQTRVDVTTVSADSLIGARVETLAGEPETLLARMSGSGATCFAICASDIEADALAERVASMQPTWWVKRCRLGGPWPD